MKENRRPIVVSVAMIIAGFSLQITGKLKSITDTVGGCMIFVGLIVFSISLHHLLKKKPDNKNVN